MEDWTKKKPIFIKPNDWQTNLIIQEIQGQEAKERIVRGEIEFHLKQYEKDIRKQICDEVLLIIDEKFNCFGYVEEKFEDIKKYVEAQIQGENNESN